MRKVCQCTLYEDWEKSEKQARRRDKLLLLKYAVIIGISVSLLILSVYGIAEIFIKSFI